MVRIHDRPCAKAHKGLSHLSAGRRCGRGSPPSQGGSARPWRARRSPRACPRRARHSRPARSRTARACPRARAAPAQHEPAGERVLRDALERFDVLEPEPGHAGATGRPAVRLRGGRRAARAPRPARRARTRRRTGSRRRPRVTRTGRPVSRSAAVADAGGERRIDRAQPLRARLLPRTRPARLLLGRAHRHPGLDDLAGEPAAAVLVGHGEHGARVPLRAARRARPCRARRRAARAGASGSRRTASTGRPARTPRRARARTRRSGARRRAPPRPGRAARGRRSRPARAGASRGRRRRERPRAPSARPASRAARQRRSPAISSNPPAWRRRTTHRLDHALRAHRVGEPVRGLGIVALARLARVRVDRLDRELRSAPTAPRRRSGPRGRGPGPAGPDRSSRLQERSTSSIATFQ